MVTPALNDSIYPLPWVDQCPLFRNYIVQGAMIFKEKLDTMKLQQSLEALIVQHGWSRLGARLRSDPSGNLEYHIPTIFSPERPAVRFCQEYRDSFLLKDALVAKLLSEASSPESISVTHQLLSICFNDQTPTRLGHYLESDEPLLHVNLITHLDATIVSLSAPHSTFDAIGLSQIVDAWSLVLQGRVEDIKVPLGPEKDHIEGIGSNLTIPHCLESKRLAGLSKLLFDLRSWRESRGRWDRRMVRLPSAFFQSLYQEAKLTAPSEELLTQNDVLCAWWTRLVGETMKEPKRLVSMAVAQSWRKAYSNDLLPADRPYLSNCMGFISVTERKKTEGGQQSLGQRAALFRHETRRQRERPQIEAYAAKWKKSSAQMPPFFGPSDMKLILQSNHTQVGWFTKNFAGARHTTVGESGGLKNASKDCHPAAFILHTHGAKPLETFIISGQDFQGNVWLDCTVPAERWDAIEDRLKGFQTRCKL